MFINTSERYGPDVAATIEDYRELNPDGEYAYGVRNGVDVILEHVNDEWAVIAEAE